MIVDNGWEPLSNTCLLMSDAERITRKVVMIVILLKNPSDKNDAKIIRSQLPHNQR